MLAKDSALGLPTESEFHVRAAERQGIDLRLITQLIGPSPQPEKHLIKELDQVAKVWPGGLGVVAVVRILTPKLHNVSLYLLMVYKPYDKAIL